MKPSVFNVLFRVDGETTLVYNTFSNALVELNDEERHHLEAYLEHPTAEYFSREGMAGLRDNFAELGVLVPEDVDEIARLRSLSSELKKQDRRFGLTIVPTLACNFQCGYCFSRASAKSLGPQAQRELLKFVEPKLKEADSLFVSWFGGEPTLCVDIIEEMSSTLSDLCKRTGAAFQGGSIVSNGYLLAGPVAERLKAAGISKAQVTLDGDRETHNRRRPLRGGAGTFDRILDNVERICETLEIQIRVNLDRKDLGAAIGALDALASRGLEKKVGVYFGHVRPFSDVCSDVAGACLSNREFSELQLEMTKQAMVRGFDSFPYPRLQLMGVCGADKPLNYVVAPDGLLFKCWAEASLGEEWSVGSLIGDVRNPKQEHNNERFLTWDPTSNESCRLCELLPICMGGCPHIRIRDPQSEDCSCWRYSLLETLAIRYKLGDRIQIRQTITPGERPVGASG